MQIVREPKPPSDFYVNGFLGALRIGMERGSQASVNCGLQSAECARIERFASQETLAKLQIAREWLERARAYEMVHGEQSMLVLDHPKNIRLRELLSRGVKDKYAVHPTGSQSS